MSDEIRQDDIVAVVTDRGERVVGRLARVEGREVEVERVALTRETLVLALTGKLASEHMPDISPRFKIEPGEVAMFWVRVDLDGYSRMVIKNGRLSKPTPHERTVAKREARRAEKNWRNK